MFDKLINIFSSKNKAQRQIQPVTKPSKPKPPKHPVTKKVKKMFRGPKSPSGYRRRLYIPTRFIKTPPHSRMAKKIEEFIRQAYYEIDCSGNALMNIDERVMGKLPIAIRWEQEISSTCYECSVLNGKVWASVSDFLNDRIFVDHSVGLYGHSHPGCRCHLIVEIGNNSVYTIYVGDLVGEPQFGSLTIEEALENLGETEQEEEWTVEKHIDDIYY